MEVELQKAKAGYKDGAAGQGFQVTGYLTLAWFGTVTLAVAPSAFNVFDPIQELLLAAGAILAAGMAFFRSLPALRGPGKISPRCLAPLICVGVILFKSTILHATPFALPGLAWWTAMLVAAILPSLLGEERILVLRGFIGVGIVQSVVLILQAVGLDPFFLLVGRFEGIWRVYGTLGNPNLAAALLVPLVLLGLDSSLIPSSRTRLAVLLVGCCGVVLTGSRAASVVLAVGILLSPGSRETLFPSRGRRTWLYVGAALTGLTFAVALFMGKGFSSPGGRLLFWETAVRLFLERPWLGFGWSSFQVAYLHGLDLLPAVRPVPEALPLHADNDWLEFGVEMGVWGLLPLLFALRVVWHGWQAAAQRPVAVAFGGLLVLSMFYSPLHTPATGLLFWFLFGVLAAAVTPRRPAERLVLPVLAASAIGLLFLLPQAGNRLRAHVTAASAELMEVTRDYRAIEAWQDAWRRCPTEGEFAFRAAYLLSLAEQYNVAQAWLGKSMETWSGFNALTLDVWLLADQGRLDEALTRLEWLERYFPDLPAGRVLRQAIDPGGGSRNSL